MMRRRALFVLLCVALAGCGDGSPQEADEPNPDARQVDAVREAAVGDMFYPGDGAILSKLLDGLLDRAGKGSPKNLRALVCPHAGYAYSGRTAALAYKQAAGGNFRTVVVLAPSHTARFDGVSVPAVGAYRTPLGLVPVSRRADTLAAAPPFASEPPCKVGRPSWWVRSSKKVSPFGKDTPHTWEHSLEVQLPFLQKVLKDFTIIPAVFGQVDTAAAAKALETVVDDTTLVIASSDLSHFHPYDEALVLDKATISVMGRLDADALKSDDACGYSPVATLLHLARAKGWKARLLEYRNSGDTSGNMSSVVGYAAIAFYDGEAPPVAAWQPPAAGQGPAYSPEQRRYLLDLARRALREVVQTGSTPKIDTAAVPPALVRYKGCFVTLTRGGRLRGCIGSIFPRELLFRAVVEMTRSAAVKDRRFPPVQKNELDKIEIEISILTMPTPLKFSSGEDLLSKLRPGIDGVILRSGARQSTYLPQVWQQMPDKADFMTNLSRKAGLPPSAWRQGGVAVLTYQAEAFHEK